MSKYLIKFYQNTRSDCTASLSLCKFSKSYCGYSRLFKRYIWQLYIVTHVCSNNGQSRCYTMDQKRACECTCGDSNRQSTQFSSIRHNIFSSNLASTLGAFERLNLFLDGFYIDIDKGEKLQGQYNSVHAWKLDLNHPSIAWHASSYS